MHVGRLALRWHPGPQIVAQRSPASLQLFGVLLNRTFKQGDYRGFLYFIFIFYYCGFRA
jgi:hypothetical protein